MENSEEGMVVRLIRYVSMVAGILLLIVTIAISLNAIGRYLLRYTSPLIAQGTYYLIPSIIALALGYALVKGGHVGAPILVDRLPVKWQRIAEVASSCLVLIFSFFFLWAGFNRVGMAFKGHEYLPGFQEIPLSFFTILPLIGIFFLLLAGGVTLAKSLKELNSGEKK